MSACYRSELIGLFGSPVDENPTGVIMEAAFKALNLNYHYHPILVKPQDLKAAIGALKAFNMKGTHITIPHKTEVLTYLDDVADDAKLMGAVNTVYLKNGRTYGENTDGKGFIISLQENNIPIQGRRAAVLGAGGAARAITIELANAGAAHITVVNRTREKGQILVDLLNHHTPACAEFVLWDHSFKVSDNTGILVNATNIGLYPETGKPDIDYPALPADVVVCDIIPNPPQTPFLQEAARRGHKILDGFSMLIHQGAISFKLWTGQDAPVQVMRQALAAEFNIEL